MLDLLARGRTNAEIANALGITFATAKWHVSTIIGKMGAATREEAVEAWRRRGGPFPRLIRAIQPLATPVPLLKASAVVLGVAAVTGLGFGVLSLRGGDGPPSPVVPTATVAATTGPTAVAVIGTGTPRLIEDRSTLDQGPSGTGWDVRLRPGANFGDSLAFILPGSPDTELALVGRSTGTLSASIKLGYQPIVLWRRSAGELLVSDGLAEPDGNEGMRLTSRVLVFDLDGLTLKRTILTPNRANFTIPPRAALDLAVALSSDERYLFYLREGNPGDQPCLAVSQFQWCGKVGIVDLADASPAPTFVELPLTCRPVRIRGITSTTAMVTCGSESYRIDVEQPRAALQSGPNLSVVGTVTLAVPAAGGGSGLLTGAGWYYPGAGGGRVRVVADDKTTRYVYRLGDERIVAGYVPQTPYLQDPEGLTIFNTRTLQIEADLRIQGLVSFAPSPNDEDLILVLQDGKVAVLNIPTSTVVGPLWQFAGGAEVLPFP